MIIDRDNVIKGLQELSDEAYSRWVHCQHTTDKLIIGIGRYVDKAVELLKEQETVFDLLVESITPDGERRRLFRCNQCKHVAYTIERVNPNYCPKCGRKVKWDD